MSQATATSDVRVLVAGSVDSGKSSTIGTLIHRQLDDGTMFAKVDKYPHERETRRTSSVSNHSLTRTSDRRVVTLANLCGHRRYLKHTIHGMTGTFADYGLLLIGTNRGITDMTIAHLNAFVHLNIPFLVVLTKLDLCPSRDMYVELHRNLRKLLKRFEREAAPLRVDGEYGLTEDPCPYLDCLAQRTAVVPIFPISNRTGKNLDILRDFLFALPSRPLWIAEDIQNDVFHITACYQVAHVGLVLAGVVKARIPIKVGDVWHIGPRGKDFIAVKVRSIHNDIRQTVEELTNGESGCLCVRFVSSKENLVRSQIRKGMILCRQPEAIAANVTDTFTARIVILQHPTTIRSRYQSVVHLGPIRQTAAILYNTDSYLRAGDTATVGFRWQHRPEYIEIGTRFFAREGDCRLAGEVLALEYNH